MQQLVLPLLNELTQSSLALRRVKFFRSDLEFHQDFLGPYRTGFREEQRDETSASTTEGRCKFTTR